MNNMYANEITMVGCISRGPVQTRDKLVHFMFKCSEKGDPFHCICQGKTAENLLEHCSVGDVATLEGQLGWIRFPDTGKICRLYRRAIGDDIASR